MMTALCFLASLQKASVLGPGMDSASLKKRWSSTWQKYWERKSSWVQMMLAPLVAARSTRLSWRARLASASGEQAIWVRPRVTMREELYFFVVRFIEKLKRWLGGD